MFPLSRHLVHATLLALAVSGFLSEHKCGQIDDTGYSFLNWPWTYLAGAAGDKLSPHWVLTVGFSVTQSYCGPIHFDMVWLRETESLR